MTELIEGFLWAFGACFGLMTFLVFVFILLETVEHTLRWWSRKQKEKLL